MPLNSKPNIPKLSFPKFLLAVVIAVHIRESVAKGTWSRTVVLIDFR